MKSSSTQESHRNPTSQEVSTYLPLVLRVVAQLGRRLPPNVQRDDLVAAGTFGLVEALRRSTHRGPAFERYARIRVRGAVVDELRAQDWLTRRARTRVARAGDPGWAMRHVVGFDDLPETHRALADATATPQEHMEWRRACVALDHAVSTLPRREADIVRWHYFDGVPFKAIAVRLGVSKPRVSQLHARAVGLLREGLRPQCLFVCATSVAGLKRKPRGRSGEATA